MRTITNYGMGFFFFCAGIFFLFHNRLGFGEYITAKDIILGIMFLLYGGWRIYRGYRKNYFN
jgi:hypothetical protein